MTDEEKKQFEAQDADDGLKRRDFLKILGGSFAALASGCGLNSPPD